MKKTFYISTPIYYPSAKLHIGHAYTTTIADALSRYKKMKGYDVFFLTGSDEHGQKIERKALENNTTPKNFVDAIVPGFLNLWKKLDIEFDKFIRTTDKYHIDTVKKIFSQLFKNGDIYLGKWTGLYCVSCEENYVESKAIKKNNDFFCVHGHKLETIEEESYFFKMSKYSQWLKDFLLDNKDFILPEERITEIIKNFLDNNLEDLSVSRTSFKWGIPITENPNHIIYVWIDALSNYITALGYLQENNLPFKKFWAEGNEIVHVMGKEITRFHCIYWPIMLKALNLRLPSKIIAHGWIVTKEGKMSKSFGNVVDPIELIDNYGSDALRYYILKQIPLGSDGQFNHELFIECYNAFLANSYGNLVFRTLGMINKYFQAKTPIFKDPQTENEKQLKEIIFSTIDSYDNCFSSNDISGAINSVDKILNGANKFIEEIKPWEKMKLNQVEELKNSIGLLVEAIKVSSKLLSPILTNSYKKVKVNFQFTEIDLEFDNLKKFLKKEKIVVIDQPLFPRIEAKN